MGCIFSYIPGSEDDDAHVKKPDQSILGINYLESKANEASEGWSVYYVEILSVHDLPDPSNILGPTGPYIEAKLMHSESEQLQRSSCKVFNQTVQWSGSDVFQFVITPADTGKILFSVYIYNPLGMPEPIGDIRWDPKKFNENNKTTISLKLVTQAGAQQGELRVTASKRPFKEALKYQTNKIFEFQRWQLEAKWGHENFLPMDPGRYAILDMSKTSTCMDDICGPLPEGWKVLQDWYVLSTNDDPDGWEYAGDFSSVVWFSSQDHSKLLVVRRRKLARELVRI